MRVTTTFHFVAERDLRWLTPSLPPAAEYCTAVAPALADVSTRALARVPASLAGLP
jgi:hypothetical protein